MAHNKAFKSLMLVQAFLSSTLGEYLHMARLFAQGQPVINGAAADGESLVRLHFAQAAIKGRQNSQPQIHTIGFAHFNSVAQKTLRAIVTRFRAPLKLINI